MPSPRRARAERKNALPPESLLGKAAPDCEKHRRERGAGSCSTRPLRRKDKRAMGLDTVELVIPFEDAFGIKIPDEIAATLETPALVIDYICGLRTTGSPTVCLAMLCFHRLRAAFIEEAACARSRRNPLPPADRSNREGIDPAILRRATISGGRIFCSGPWSRLRCPPVLGAGCRSPHSLHGEAAGVGSSGKFRSLSGVEDEGEVSGGGQLLDPHAPRGRARWRVPPGPPGRGGWRSGLGRGVRRTGCGIHQSFLSLFERWRRLRPY